jgi:hypothetical protein
MTHTATAPARPETLGVAGETIALARNEVRDLLSQSEAFRALPREQQIEIARNTATVAAALAEEGRQARRAPAGDPYAQVLADAPAAGTPAPTIREKRREGEFVAQAAQEGARVAGALLREVDFPTFVANLIKGVFHAIVESSIDQMEAYGRLVSDVAKSLNEFRDENVSVNQGRDHLIDSFPDTFMLDVDTGEDGAQPRVRLRDGVDEDEAVKRLNGSLPLEGPPLSGLDDETIEERLVPAARMQLATSRHQLLATMVVMGINRIVVTDGRISAKVLYNFQAKDNFRFQRSATQFDYGDQYKYASEGESEQQYEGRDRSYTREGDKSEYTARDGGYYAKGKYKSQAEPVLKLVSATQEQTDAALTTNASLAGTVDINFKSDYLPLEKMADSFQIARIQEAAQPGQRGTAGAPAATATPAPATPAPAAPPAR